MYAVQGDKIKVGYVSTHVVKPLCIYVAQCTLEYICCCSTSQHTDSCLTFPRLFCAAGAFSQKTRKGKGKIQKCHMLFPK